MESTGERRGVGGGGGMRKGDLGRKKKPPLIGIRLKKERIRSPKEGSLKQNFHQKDRRTKKERKTEGLAKACCDVKEKEGKSGRKKNPERLTRLKDRKTVNKNLTKRQERGKMSHEKEQEKTV